MTNRHSDLIKNTLIISFGKLSTQFVTFLLLPLYTAYLSSSEFGTVDLILTYVILLAPILTIQLEMASFRHLIDARHNESQKRTVISNVLQMVSKNVLLFAGVFLILTHFVNIPYANLLLGAVVATIFIGLFLQFARGLGENAKFSIGSIVAGMTTIIANVAFIVGLGMGPEGMLSATIIGNSVGALYLFSTLELHRFISISNGDKKLRRQLIGYSAPLVPNGVAWWAINAADRTIVTIFLGVATNGIFAVAYRFPMIFTGLFSFFGMSWTESASVHINSKDRDKFFSETMNASVRLFGSLGLGVIATIPLFFTLLVNDNYREAYMYIPILMVGAFFNTIVGLYSAIYIAKKMTKQVASTSIFAAIISISFTLTFINLLGLYAAAFAMPISFLIMAIYRHFDIKQYITITYEKRTFMILAIMYTITIGLYYVNDPLINVANLFITIILIFVFNRSIVAVITNKVINLRSEKRSTLTSDQQLYEDTL